MITSNAKRALRSIPSLIIFFVVSFFLLYSFLFTVNYPFQDDLLLLNFVNEVVNGVDLPTFFELLFRTDNDHKVVIPRLIAFINYLISGTLNYKLYIALVWINLLFMLYFLYVQFKKMGLPLVYFIPVPLLFLQPQYYEVSQWAINGMQHSFLTVFLIASLYLVSIPRRGFYAGALLLCFLATFTHGNGILSFPALTFYFLCQKDFKKALGAVLGMLVALFIYLFGYEKGQAVGAPTDVMMVVYNFFGFVGALMSQWNHWLLASVIWGIVILGYSAYLVGKVVRTYFRPYEKVSPKVNVKLLSIICFITLTSLVIAVARTSQGSTLASRFELYAALGSAILYLLLLENTRFFKQKYILGLVLVLSGFVNIHSYYKYTGIVADRRTIYEADIFNWGATRTLLSVDKSLQQNAAFYLYPAAERGILKLPDPLISESELQALWKDKRKSPGKVPLFLEKEAWFGPGTLNDTLVFLSNSTFPSLESPLYNRFIVLRAEGSEQFYLMAGNPKLSGRRNLVRSGHYYVQGFQSYIRENNLPDGQYEVGLLDIKNREKKQLTVLMASLQLKNGSIQIQQDPALVPEIH